mmetsp:Transcript_6203/g.9531  ORF Transcript_6203/g.9531 Transcript_6203/m.9531 type:complete len:613 (+) Transcript_6203:204-2042(+)|eukprot:CAMPEP_0178913948 /NCGR_PEP_ID=MMETSP0786-20121207/11134_1 /TAXON_ID=186022 /ORGANISM="Thalassionema frauenfeldii, Strain CCMP 1798" /LENGTH=612 /DNA_ID=CAMNT_0020586763 /DNA_START=133 /DNA_END=1971 /DNA_ORIENTATION=+
MTMTTSVENSAEKRLTNLENGGKKGAAANNRRTSTMVDISQNHSIGPAPIFGRESHTADLDEFDKALELMKNYERSPTDPPMSESFWATIRSGLAEFIEGVGYEELENAESTIVKGPNDISNLITRVVGMSAYNPIHPARLVNEIEESTDTILTELMYATKVGLVAMQWAPECERCGSAVLIRSHLGQLPASAHCNGCHQKNDVLSLDKIMVSFMFSPNILYILANNFACTLSERSANANVVFAPMLATNTGSGFRYSVGCGDELKIGESLKKGRYRMHCPVSMTDVFLEVESDVQDTDTPVELRLPVSEMVIHDPQEKLKTISVPHGMIHFDLLPDTRSFFVLWIQNALDDEVLLRLPPEERGPYTTASEVINHGAFHLFHDQVVPRTPNALSISDVVIVFTDIVGSTSMYATLGDGPALELVRNHFEILFSIFASKGRVVKTIGDAVMGSFSSGKAAIEAVAESIQEIPRHCTHPETKQPLEIRVGIHHGSAVVVPVNGMNDYFGQTINVAARIEASAGASECLVSAAVLEEPGAKEVFDTLIEDNSNLEATPKRCLNLKGVAVPVKAQGFRLIKSEEVEKQPKNGVALAIDWARRSLVFQKRGSHQGGP